MFLSADLRSTHFANITARLVEIKALVRKGRTDLVPGVAKTIWRVVANLQVYDVWHKLTEPQLATIIVFNQFILILIFNLLI